MRRLVGLVLTLLALAGCGSSNRFWQDAQQPAPPATIYRLAVLSPLEAGQVEFGRGLRNGAQLAVDQWNAAHPNGPHFQLEAFNDSSDPTVGQASAQQILELPNLVGVVGTYNSGVAAAVMPAFEARGIPMISPGNTDPTLTLGPDWTAPVRQFSNYFRLVVPDHLQGPALADYAFSDLGFRRLAILSENKPVSQGLADAFRQRFEELGGELTSVQIAPEGTTDYSALLQAIALTTPSALFYAGEVPNASWVRQQATGSGLAVPMIGGDGMKAQAYIEEAGVSTEGDVASSLGVPADLLPSAAQFLTDYAASGFAEPASDFGPYAYDAATLLMLAAEATGGDPRSIPGFLQQVDRAGVTGRLAFDAFGDTRNRVLTVHQVSGGAFLPVAIVSLDD